jgi:deoxyadenosine/deoxycytidine kinase
MGHLIAIVGNAGVGKTTLANVLCQHLQLTSALEQHSERPFQALFAAHGAHYALVNQIDYLLVRAEQELTIRRGALDGVVDGGLEVDFHVFTRHFWQSGKLDAAEYALCERLYATLRQLLPPPDLIIELTAPLEVVAERHRRRNRSLEIATAGDLADLAALLERWLADVPPERRLTIDASADDRTFAAALGVIATRLEKL